MKKKIQVTNWSILMTVASTTLYIVFRNLGREVGSFAFLWAPITLLLIIYNRPNVFAKGPIRILFLYGILIVGILQYTLWKYMNDCNKIRVLYEFYYLVIMLAILEYYRSKGNFKRLAWLSKWTFIFIIISLISTNVALYFDPYVVRESAATERFTQYQAEIFKLTGAMGYSYIQAIVCLIPIIIYHIKRKKKMVFSTKILFVILLLIYITEIRSQVFANILVAILITILSLVGSKKSRTSFITILLIGILFIAIPSSFYTNIFNSLSSHFSPDSEMYYKLTDFAEFIEDPEFESSTGAGYRAERYPLLFKAFLANPFFGDASYDSSLTVLTGVHLYWMNRLTLWGILGFLFFIFVLYKIYRSISSLFDSGYSFYYFLSVLTLILLGLIKTIAGREPWLMLIVVIPGLYFLPLLKHTKNTKI